MAQASQLFPVPQLHEQPTALVFCRDGVVRYVERHADFPVLACRSGGSAPLLPTARSGDCLSGHEEADWRDWLLRPPGGDLVIQALRQQNGFAIILLAIDRSDDDEDVEGARR